MLEAFVRRRHAAWLAVGLGLLLASPALFAGWRSDDWIHQAFLRGLWTPTDYHGAAMGLFRFLDGDPEHARPMVDYGGLPWWMPLDIRLSLWRPVSAVTHVLDHAGAPGSAVFAHAHSLLWAALLFLAGAALFRRVHGVGAVAALAALIFALDEAHGIPIGWIANRNALVAGVFGVATLHLHLRWRGGHPASAVAAALAYLLALLSAESAVGVLGFLGAAALTLDPAPRLWRRLATIAPYLLITVAWRIAYHQLGYGAAGSGLYLDPIREPGAFVSAALERVPVLLADLFFSLPSLVVSFLPDSGAHLWAAVGAGLLLLLARALAPLLRASPTARFWALGTLLSTVPLAATFPSNRLLVFPSLGAAALVAEAMAAFGVWLAPPPGQVPPMPRSGRGLVTVVAVVQLVVAPLALPLNALGIALLSDLLFERCEESLPEDPSLETSTLILMNSNELCVRDALFIRLADRRPAPARARLLAPAIYDVEVTGVDEHTVDVHVPAGYHSAATDRLLRSVDDPLPVGAVVALTGLRLEVQSHNARGLVDRVRATFDRPLRDPTLLWRCTRAFRVVPCEPPAPGETVRLPAPRL